ncbi:MAG: hypothetical protein ACRDND_09950 [Streptosporangiaceae bacterium]
MAQHQTGAAVPEGYRYTSTAGVFGDRCASRTHPVPGAAHAGAAPSSPVSSITAIAAST